MKWKLIRAFTMVATILLSPSLPGVAQEFEKNILTGGPNGTYIQFGRDIADIAKECDLTLNVRESAGSLENFLGVRERRVTQFGIVQSDVLEYLRTYAADDPAIARAISGVRIAFPLYDEEVHVLARRDIAGLQDLAGRRIAIGVQDSGTFLTASLVLDLAGVQDTTRLTIGPDESLRQLKAGEIDALFYVAGVPTKLFDDASIDTEKFHFVTISDPVLQAIYAPTTIDGGTYPFQAEAVQTIAVKAVLMTYGYDPRRNAYHRESCNAVRDISHLIFSRFDALQENGHPKWKQVDLNEIPPGWEIGACVNAGLDADYALSCGTEITPPEELSGANAVYRERICSVIGC